MLLTSSQVSIAISSAIVVFFTLALFLSGYAIQQRTLRDLRAAIKPSPRPSPKIFLPDRFRKSTTELPDGTVVAVDDDFDRSAAARRIRRKRPGPVVEVRPTVPEDRTAGEQQQQQQQQQQNVMAPDKQGQAGQPAGKVSGAGSPWADRAAADSRDDDLVPNPNDNTQKPVSRAERRRLIKEEIRRLAQGEKPVYYQPRLW
ncbi:hypothetical protein NKR23_g1999 [Pleurostoma richardsiae]|uniref:Uncharacterized protein n=1 Tax=Pleurostoma richardsiae TaxID=41990 RepID=A0AA38RNB9_9PEZI|nr:hypothetical protein NKR23_g1999 [Pleurostoma richardsiae]